MATLTQKTTTTTMVPAVTRGISIIIEQDPQQQQVVYNEKNQIRTTTTTVPSIRTKTTTANEFILQKENSFQEQKQNEEKKAEAEYRQANEKKLPAIKIVQTNLKDLNYQQQQQLHEQTKQKEVLVKKEEKSEVEEQDHFRYLDAKDAEREETENKKSFKPLFEIKTKTHQTQMSPIIQTTQIETKITKTNVIETIIPTTTTRIPNSPKASIYSPASNASSKVNHVENEKGIFANNYQKTSINITYDDNELNDNEVNNNDLQNKESSNDTVDHHHHHYHGGDFNSSQFSPHLVLNLPIQKDHHDVFQLKPNQNKTKIKNNHNEVNSGHTTIIKCFEDSLTKKQDDDVNGEENMKKKDFLVYENRVAGGEETSADNHNEKSSTSISKAKATPTTLSGENVGHCGNEEQKSILVKDEESQKHYQSAINTTETAAPNHHSRSINSNSSSVSKTNGKKAATTNSNGDFADVGQQLSPKTEQATTTTTTVTTISSSQKEKLIKHFFKEEWSTKVGNNIATEKEAFSLATNVDSDASATIPKTSSANTNSEILSTSSSTTSSNNKHIVNIKIDTKDQNIDTNPNKNNKQIIGKQVTVVKLNESSPLENLVLESISKEIENSAEVKSLKDQELNLNLKIDNMVQKPSMVISANKNSTISNNSSNTNTNNNTINNNCGSSVTDLNVDNSPYHLYYMMSSSGQFSPCETLDSGTGSDLESNTNLPANQNDNLNIVNAPKLEMNLKTTKIRVSSASSKRSSKDPNKNNLSNQFIEHMRACSLTDSEESESSSSLSCDSLHSSEFNRQSSVSPIGNKPSTNKSIGSLLPDSLLRDIRDRKFASHDFDTEYRKSSSNHQSLESVNENDFENEIENENEHNHRNNNENVNVNLSETDNKHIDINDDNIKNSLVNKLIAHQTQSSQAYRNDKRSSLPNKTFILDKQNGSFVDTKLNSMPRKYEADQFYNFHVNEHANFRSFGNNNHFNINSLTGNSANILNDFNNSNGGSSLEGRESQTSFREDDFAGFRDIRCGSATSTIRSSKGTVRGVKNRVRNGIATFLQLQQPNIKNYKEKDNGKVVLYTTSMGIIRDTYAKCSNVKQILRTLLVKFEERDVFMSLEYQQEIKERMNSNVIRVPQLFVEGQYIGDADVVERLNESGELRQLLKPYKSIATAYTCQTCGGYRLLPCPSCNGSKKSVHRNHFTAEFVALKCMNCDEVGLVKCHNC